jgi:hypothetical protein
MINFRNAVMPRKTQLYGSGVKAFRISSATPFRRFTEHHGTTGGSLTDHPDYVGSRSGSYRQYPARLSVFGFTLWRKCPSRVSDIAPDDPRRYQGTGWRVETRGPEEMMKAGGFSGNGADDDIKRHVRGGLTAHLNSRLCSWSRFPNGTQCVARGLAHHKSDVSLYLYQADLFRHNTFDTEWDALPQAILNSEQEVVCAMTGLRDITSVTLPRTAGGEPQKILFPFRPHSGLSIDHSVTTPDPWLPDSSVP